MKEVQQSLSLKSCSSNVEKSANNHYQRVAWVGNI